MFSEMLLWRPHPPLLRNRSVKTYEKRGWWHPKTFPNQQLCFEYDTKQKYMWACLQLHAKNRRLHFCDAECSWLFLLPDKDGVGSRWQAGSLLLPRHLPVKCQECSLGRGDFIEVKKLYWDPSEGLFKRFERLLFLVPEEKREKKRKKIISHHACRKGG